MDFNSSSTNSTLSSSHSLSIFPPPPSSSSSSNFSTALLDKEHMFDKVVTPSDVGKLNRLVIPKQHAQKYFPLERTSGRWNLLDNDSSSEKGLLLNFEEDRTHGKIWRFRYSYWSSSQSYVITKGWSRFVKDKKLNSGDVISFYRAKDRLFIDWRYQIHQQHQQQHFYFNQQRYWSAPGPLFSPNLYYFNQPSNITAMDPHSFLGRRPLIVGGYGYGEVHEPGADQGMNMRSEAQQQRPHEIGMWNSGIMSTRGSADNDDDVDEDEEDRETEEEEEEEAAAIHELLDSEAEPVHRAGEMKQLRLFGVNMKCAAPHGR